MRTKLKIFLTNWVNILVIFIAVYAVAIISELLKIQSTHNIPAALGTGFLDGSFAIILYGAIFWAGFIVAMFLLDFLFMNESKTCMDFFYCIKHIVLQCNYGSMRTAGNRGKHLPARLLGLAYSESFTKKANDNSWF